MKKPNLPVLRSEQTFTEISTTADSRIVSTGLADRLQERQLARRRLLRQRIKNVLAVVLVAVFLLWLLLFSPLLALRTQDIALSGADDTVSAEQVQKVLEPYEGKSLLRLNLSQLGNDVASSLVHVRTASVVREWPHGLTVRVEPRTPVAVRENSSGYAVLDSEAVVLEQVSQRPDGLVLIRSADDTTLSGSQIADLTAAVGALDQQTRALVSYGTVSATGQITLTLNSGAEVTWGESKENALKAKVLGVLVSQSARLYDVSSPRTPSTAE